MFDVFDAHDKEVLASLTSDELRRVLGEESLSALNTTVESLRSKASSAGYGMSSLAIQTSGVESFGLDWIAYVDRL